MGIPEVSAFRKVIDSGRSHLLALHLRGKSILVEVIDDPQSRLVAVFVVQEMSEYVIREFRLLLRQGLVHSSVPIFIMRVKWNQLTNTRSCCLNG